MRSISDDDLMFALLGLLGRPEWDDTPLIAGASHRAASCARFAFCELAERWLPPGLYMGAIERLYDERPDLTLIEGGVVDAR